MDSSLCLACRFFNVFRAVLLVAELEGLRGGEASCLSSGGAGDFGGLISFVLERGREPSGLNWGWLETLSI